MNLGNRSLYVAVPVFSLDAISIRVESLTVPLSLISDIVKGQKVINPLSKMFECV